MYAFLDNERKNTFKFLIFYNVLFFGLYAICRYIVQTNYSSFDMSQVDHNLA